MKQYMYIEVSPNVCGNSRSGSVDSHWWFVLCWLHKPYWCYMTDPTSRQRGRPK
jgi:hypothetical protein